MFMIDFVVPIYSFTVILCSHRMSLNNSVVPVSSCLVRLFIVRVRHLKVFVWCLNTQFFYRWHQMFYKNYFSYMQKMFKKNIFLCCHFPLRYISTLSLRRSTYTNAILLQSSANLIHQASVTSSEISQRSFCTTEI